MRRQQRAESEYRRRNIFELYIEEVVEACHHLKGGKLAKEKLKAQLQKIAATRTGGMKTDEVLGKTGAGPEGLPNSIIVTPEGIEGDVPVASEVDASVGHTPAPEVIASQTDLLDDEEPRKSEKATKARGTKRVTPQRTGVKKSKRKADQLSLFSAKESSPQKPTERAARPVKTLPSRSATGKKK